MASEQTHPTAKSSVRLFALLPLVAFRDLQVLRCLAEENEFSFTQTTYSRVSTASDEEFRVYSRGTAGALWAD